MSEANVWAAGSITDLGGIEKINEVLTRFGAETCPCCRSGDADLNGVGREALWAKAGFANPKFQTMGAQEINPGAASKKFTHQIKLTSVVFRNAGWSVDEVKRRLKKVSNVYAQCGIRLTESTIVEVDAPNGWVDVSFSGRKQKDLRIAEMLPRTARPVVFYVRSTGEGEAAYAWSSRMGQPSYLSDTAWITADVLNKTHSSNRVGYSVEAHELAHIFCDSPHLEVGGNILTNDNDHRNDSITKAQCETMKRSPLVETL